MIKCVCAYVVKTITLILSDYTLNSTIDLLYLYYIVFIVFHNIHVVMFSSSMIGSDTYWNYR